MAARAAATWSIQKAVVGSEDFSGLADGGGEAAERRGHPRDGPIDAIRDSCR